MYNLIEEVLVQICKGQVNASLIRAICRQVKRFIKIFIKLLKKLFTIITKSVIIILTKGKENPQNQKEINKMKNINNVSIAKEVEKKLLQLKDEKKCYQLYNIYRVYLDDILDFEGLYILDDFDNDTIAKWIADKNLINYDNNHTFVYINAYGHVNSVSNNDASDEIYNMIIEMLKDSEDYPDKVTELYETINEIL